MIYLSEKLREYRLMKGYTQEDIADYLNVTPQSVSKWERAECYPDIELLPILANILGTSIDMLMGMDDIRAEDAIYSVHKKASEYQGNGDYSSCEEVYRKTLRLYPDNAGLMLGLGGVLALLDKSSEAIEIIEKGLKLSDSEKQNATMRAVLCFLYYKYDRLDDSKKIAASLPHIRECREMILPMIECDTDRKDIDKYISLLLIGE